MYWDLISKDFNFKSGCRKSNKLQVNNNFQDTGATGLIGKKYEPLNAINNVVKIA